MANANTSLSQVGCAPVSRQGADQTPGGGGAGPQAAEARAGTATLACRLGDRNTECGVSAHTTGGLASCR